MECWGLWGFIISSTETATINKFALVFISFCHLFTNRFSTETAWRTEALDV